MDRIDRICAKEIECAGAKLARYAGPGTTTDAELDAVAAGLGVELPRDYRRYVRRLGIRRGDAELVLARMSSLLLVTTWDEIFARMIGGHPALSRAIRTRGLLPLGDDYSGRFWICLDLAHRRPDGDCPVVELELEGDFDKIAANLEPHLQRFGDTFGEGAEAVIARST